MKKTLAFILGCVMLLAVLSGCTSSQSSTANATTKASTAASAAASASASSDTAAVKPASIKKASEIKIFVEHFKNNSAVNMQWRYGCLKAAEELGVKVDVDASDDGSIEKNIALDEQAIAQRYDGICCIAATAASYVPVIEEAAKLNIPFMTFHQDAPESKRVAYFGPDMIANAKAAARFMADKMGKKGKVITIQGAASDAESLVVDTYVKELNSYAPDMKVITRISDTLDAAKAYEKISAAIQADPEITGFFGCTQRAGSDVAKICEEKGMDFSKLCIFTNDVVPVNVQLLQDGKIHGINDQGALKSGYLAVKAMVEYLTTGKLTNYKYGVNYLPTNIVTQDTVKDYLEVNKIIDDMVKAAAASKAAKATAAPTATK